MRQCSAFVLILFLTTPLFAGENYYAQFKKFYDANDFQGALKATQNWEKSEPNNPQAFIEEANCYIGMGTKEAIEINQKTPTDGDLVLTKDDNPKEKWVMGSHQQFDPVICQKGIDVLEAAIQRFPYRLDIWFGLAYMYQNLDQFPKMLDVLTRASVYVTAHPKGLLESADTPLKVSILKYMPETIHEYCITFAQSGKAGDADKFVELSQLMVQYFPNHSYGYDNLGGYYAAMKQWPQALKYYGTAAKLAPEDPLEWHNLGIVYRDSGDKVNAKKCFQKIVTLNNNPDAVKEAKEKLAELSK